MNKLQYSGGKKSWIIRFAVVHVYILTMFPYFLVI